MKVKIEEIPIEQEEELILRCHEINEDMLKLIQSIKDIKSGLVGIQGEKIHKLHIEDVYYFEVVDNHAFIYCKNQVYESKLKLYEFEKLTISGSFFRASKSMVVNADKIDYVAPSFSGRFEVTLLNHEKVTVSRQYVKDLKKKMGV